MTIFEEDRRRNDWVAGRDILLEDDQPWTFPLPRIALTLSLSGADPVATVDLQDTSRRFSHKYWEQVDAARDKFAGGSVVNDLDYAKALLPIAANLLRRNYQLSDEEVTTLLQFRGIDKRNLEMWEQIFNLIFNIGPKPDPAG